MQGIFHSYYSVELAPAVAALVALGATLLWRRGTAGALLVLAGVSAVTSCWAVTLVHRWASGTVLELVAGTVGAVAAAALVYLALTRLRNAERPALRRAVVATAVLAAVLGPFAWSVATAALPHSGSAVHAGPVQGPPETVTGVSPAALALLRRDTDDWTWTAAVVGSRANDLQLASGAPVMPIGGFAGSDPSPTLRAFQSDVARHRVHWYVPAPTGHGPGRSISAWVRAHAPVVRAGGTTLYDVGQLAPSDGDDDRP
jgi:hypothetical protein